MTAFHLKIIALTTMLIDHLGAVFPQHFGFEFRVVGRVAFPIYVYLVAEGFRHTKSPLKFLLRLGAFALISEPFFDMAIRRAQLPWGVDFLNNTNIFYTLFLGGAAIYALQLVRTKLTPVIENIAADILSIAPLIVCMWIAETVLTSDYGAYGVAFIFLMYVIKPPKLRLAAMAVLCVYQHQNLVRQLVNYLFFDGTFLAPTVFFMMIPATLVTVVLVAFYNGRRGPSFKWFFYASYPVHLLILGVVSLLI